MFELETQAPLPRVLLVVVLLAAMGGCGTARVMPLEQETAREALTATLELWKQGGRPEELRDQSPPIVTGDPDWEAGNKLVAYEPPREELDDGFNLHMSVQLVIEGPTGQQRRRTVTYVVGTSPVITVFRK